MSRGHRLRKNVKCEVEAVPNGCFLPGKISHTFVSNVMTLLHVNIHFRPMEQEEPFFAIILARSMASRVQTWEPAYFDWNIYFLAIKSPHPTFYFQAQSPYLPHCGGVDVHFSGATDCFRQIVKAQGVLGLWNGLAANLLKVRRVVSLYCFSTSSSSFATSPIVWMEMPPSSIDDNQRPMSTAWLSTLKREDLVQCWGIWYPIPEELII